MIPWLAWALCAFLPTPTGKEQQEELAKGPFPKERSHPAALPKEPYALSWSEATRYVTRRQLKLVSRDKIVLRGRMMQVGVQEKAL